MEFAGFDMPVRYSGDVREHQCVRRAVGLFDISHMGEFHVEGASALEFLNRAVTNDVASLAVGQALYSPLCRPDGGIVDDLLVYRAESHFMVVVNASNIDKDFAWLKAQVPAGVTFENRSDRTALLAVQGPKACEVLRGHVPDAALDLGYYRFAIDRAFGVPAWIHARATRARTGSALLRRPARRPYGKA